MAVQAALDRAARNNPTIYKPPTKQHQHQQHPPGHHHRVSTSPVGGGVSYPEEYEGNEPMDESWVQQPLEPTVAPSFGSGDDSGLRGSGRRGSLRMSMMSRMSRSHREVDDDDEGHLRSSSKRHSVRE